MGKIVSGSALSLALLVIAPGAHAFLGTLLASAFGMVQSELTDAALGWIASNIGSSPDGYQWMEHEAQCSPYENWESEYHLQEFEVLGVSFTAQDYRDLSQHSTPATVYNLLENFRANCVRSAGLVPDGTDGTYQTEVDLPFFLGRNDAGEILTCASMVPGHEHFLQRTEVRSYQLPDVLVSRCSLLSTPVPPLWGC